MPVLTARVIGQAENAASDHAECGKLAALSVVQVWFSSVTALDILDNADAQQVSDGIDAVSGMASRCQAFNQADLVAAIGAGHYVLVGVNVNGYCVLQTAVTGIRHWVAVYSDATLADLYNCWPAALQTGDVATCASSVMDMVIVAGPTPATGETMNPDQANALSAYIDILAGKVGLTCPVGTGPAAASAFAAGSVADAAIANLKRTHRKAKTITK